MFTLLSFIPLLSLIVIKSVLGVNSLSIINDTNYSLIFYLIFLMFTMPLNISFFYRIFLRKYRKRMFVWLKCCYQLKLSKEDLLKIIPKKYILFIQRENELRELFQIFKIKSRSL